MITSVELQEIIDGEILFFVINTDASNINKVIFKMKEIVFFY